FRRFPKPPGGISTYRHHRWPAASGRLSSAVTDHYSERITVLAKLHFPSLRKGALVCSIAIVLAVILVFAYLVLQERRAEDLAEDFGNPESYLPSVTELGW